MQCHLILRKLIAIAAISLMTMLSFYYFANDSDCFYRTLTEANAHGCICKNPQHVADETFPKDRRIWQSLWPRKFSKAPASHTPMFPFALSFEVQDKSRASRLLSNFFPTLSLNHEACRSLQILFLFVGAPNLGSNLVRGFALADELRLRHHHVSFLELSKLRNPVTEFPSLRIPYLSACIILRDWTLLSQKDQDYSWIKRSCRHYGGLLIWDALDTPVVVDDHMLATLQPDIVIASSSFHKHCLQQRLKKFTGSIHVIAHPHTNSGIVSHRILGHRRHTIGYTSSPLNSPNVSGLLPLFARHNISFVGNINPLALHDCLSPSEIQKIDPMFQTPFHSAVDRLSIDVAFILDWATRLEDPLPHSERPLTRLIFWMSHGVPTIVSRMANYVELLAILGLEDDLVIDSIDQFESRLLKVTQNASLYHHISRTFLEAAQYFTLSTNADALTHLICTERGQLNL